MISWLEQARARYKKGMSRSLIESNYSFNHFFSDIPYWFVWQEGFPWDRFETLIFKTNWNSIVSGLLLNPWKMLFLVNIIWTCLTLNCKMPPGWIPTVVAKTHLIWQLKWHLSGHSRLIFTKQQNSYQYRNNTFYQKCNKIATLKSANLIKGFWWNGDNTWKRFTCEHVPERQLLCWSRKVAGHICTPYKFS